MDLGLTRADKGLCDGDSDARSAAALRYVLEVAHTGFFGELDGAFGFNQRSSLGTGLELDSSAYDIAVTRTRLMARYQFGAHVSGWSVGLAVSF